MTERENTTVNRKTKRYLRLAGGLFLIFTVFTVLVSVFDVQPIGPDGSEIGLAVLNRFVHQKTGINILWYHMTQWLGGIAVLFAFGFAALGLKQLAAGKSIG